MDVFDVYPQLADVETPLIVARALRLIALSAIVYDDEAFYFEISPRDMWGRLSSGRAAIGVGAVKVRPDAYNTPIFALTRHLRKSWRCDVSSVSLGHTYVLGEDEQTTVLGDVPDTHPYMLILTPPRLGGGDEVPDALVQAIHLLKVLRFRKSLPGVSVLKIARSAWTHFLEPVDWDVQHLMAQPWAEFMLSTSLPPDATIRPVLALRGLQRFLKVGGLPQTLIPVEV